MLLAFSPLPLPSLWFLQLQLPALWPLLLTSGTAATAFWCSIYFTAPPLHCLRYGDARTLHMKCQLRDGLSPEGEPCELIEDEQLDAITRISNTKWVPFDKLLTVTYIWLAAPCHNSVLFDILGWYYINAMQVSCTSPFQRGCFSFLLLSLLSDTYPAIAKNQKIAICLRHIGKVPPLTKSNTSETLFHGANELLLIVTWVVLQQETSGSL